MPPTQPCAMTGGRGSARAQGEGHSHALESSHPATTRAPARVPLAAPVPAPSPPNSAGLAGPCTRWWEWSNLEKAGMVAVAVVIVLIVIAVAAGSARQ